MIQRRYTVVFLLICVGVRVNLARRAVAKEHDNDGVGSIYGESCALHIRTDVAKHRTPLLLYPGTLHLVRSSHNTVGTIVSTANSAIQVICPGTDNYVQHVVGNRSDVLVRCAGGTRVRLDDDAKTVLEMRQLECSKWPEHLTHVNGTCLWGKVRLVTGFQVANGFVPVYESCFDSTDSHTVYTKYVLTRDANSAQSGVPRSAWRGREHYKTDPNRLYQKKGQRNAIAALVGSDELADTYIQSKGDVFLSKGHLAAKTDFLMGAAQTATMRYTNAAPQWQTFNGNNWNALENDVRAYVQRLGRDVVCYTGTFGRATLPDWNGRQVELFLGPNGTIPVPRIYWKVLYDADTQRGIAFVGLNNPHQKREDALVDVRCRNICKRLTGWELTWKPDDLHRGISYCCEVNDFRANFPDVLPDFVVVGILNEYK